MLKRISLLAVVPAAVALVMAGCGGSSNGGSSSHKTAAASTPATHGGGHTLTLSADPGGQLRFDTARLTAKSGKVTIRMENPPSAGMDHGIAVEGNGVDSDGPTVAPGNTSTLTVTLKKGTYEYYCPVPGHKEAGMTGTLMVR